MLFSFASPRLTRIYLSLLGPAARSGVTDSRATPRRSRCRRAAIESLTGDEEASPLGAKGLGELTAVSVAPAIANAVYHATGKRMRDLPITVEKLL
jgi:hypothetical protein